MSQFGQLLQPDELRIQGYQNHILYWIRNSPLIDVGITEALVSVLKNDPYFIHLLGSGQLLELTQG